MPLVSLWWVPHPWALSMSRGGVFGGIARWPSSMSNWSGRPASLIPGWNQEEVLQPSWLAGGERGGVGSVLQTLLSAELASVSRRWKIEPGPHSLRCGYDIRTGKPSKPALSRQQPPPPFPDRLSVRFVPADCGIGLRHRVHGTYPGLG